MAGSLGGLRHPRRRLASGAAAALAGLMTAVAIGGCAYGTSTSALPAHLKTIAIPTFQNESTEYTLAQDVTDACIQRFVASNSLRVVDERSADVVLRGKVTDYRNSVFGISDLALAQEYRVTIAVSVVFKDQVKNREIWTDENLVKTANYYVAGVPGDSARTEVDGRREAVRKIADEVFARSVEAW